ncbi:oligosaccharide flippase family protein [Sphingobacterium thalpophilum]|uniref:oligosaccharide flippase family protein n=1 Tax=Sphingobacterium thalpophilum TaxID=259 RepID=UPI003C759B99
MSEQGQVKKNLLFNILSLVANVGVGIIYTPYLVKSLGLIAYGVVPLALIINQYVSVLTGSLTSALTRFYSIALQRNDLKEASKYISTSLIVVAGIIVVLIGPLYYLVQHVDAVFTIPNNLVESAKILFLFTMISFGVSLISSVFNITLYAYNRLDYMNIIKIFRISLKLGFVILLFTCLEKDIAYVGIANFLTEFVILIFSIYAFVRFTKGSVRVNVKLFDSASLSLLSAMASWVIVQQLGDTMLYRIDNIIVNKFWSTKESGILGAFTELGTYTMIISSVIGSLFGPLILQAYSREDHDTVRKMTLDRSVGVGVMVAVMIGIICGFSPIILKVWLGADFVAYNQWLYLKLFLVPFYSAAGVFAFASRAWNRVRIPAIWTVLLGVLNLGIVWLIAKYGSGGLESVVYILSVCLIFGIAQSYFLNGLVFGGIYENTSRIVVFNALKIFLVLIVVSLVGCFLSPYLLPLNASLSLCIVAVSGIICLVVSFKTALNSEQALSMIELVYKK